MLFASLCAICLLGMLWLPVAGAAEADADALEHQISEVDSQAKKIPEEITDYAIAHQSLQYSDLVSMSEQPARTMLVLDEDKDGSLSAQEVSNARRTLLKMDADSDGALSPKELGVKLLHPTTLRLHKLDRVLDVDGDYQISTQEVVDAEKYLRSLDVNGDWRLDSLELRDSYSEGQLVRWSKIFDAEALAKAGREIPLGSDKAGVDEFYLLQQTDFEHGLVIGGGTQLLNVNREVVHQWPKRPNKLLGPHAELLANGLLLRTISPLDSANHSGAIEEGYSELELLDWNGNVIWEYQHCANNERCLHGPVVVRQNGNVLVMEKAFVKDDAGSDLQISILELKPDYNNKSTKLVSSMPIEHISGNEAFASVQNHLAFTEEQAKILVSSHDGQYVWLINRDNESSSDNVIGTDGAYEIKISDLLKQANIDARSKVHLLELHCLSEVPGKGDVALLLDVDANQFVLELALPMNKNGTYASDRQIEIVRRLDVFNDRKVTGVRSVDGAYQLILGDSSQIELRHGSSAYERRLYGKGRISDLKIYPSNYAAFTDKDSIQSNLTENLKYRTAPEEQSVQATLKGQTGTEHLTGIWSMMIETTVGDETSELTLVQQGELIAGSLDGEPLTIALDGNIIEFTLERVSPTGVVKIIYNGIVNESGMQGEYAMASGPTIGTVRAWKAKR